MTLINLEKTAQDFTEKKNQVKRRIIICGGTGCIANGSLRVRDAMIREMKKVGLDVDVELRKEGKQDVYFSKSGCQGFCQKGPILRIEPEGIFYGHVKEEDAAEIVNATLIGGDIIDRLVYVNPVSKKASPYEKDIEFYSRQNRVILRNYAIDPENVDEYIERGGYFLSLIHI